MENKYLKYKQKYLNLKNLYFKSIGGVGPTNDYEDKRIEETQKELDEKIESRALKQIELTRLKGLREINPDNHIITRLNDDITILNAEIFKLQNSIFRSK
jgi:hypothetical protein